MPSNLALIIIIASIVIGIFYHFFVLPNLTKEKNKKSNQLFEEHSTNIEFEPLNIKNYEIFLKFKKLISIKFYQINEYEYKISETISIFEGIELTLENGFFSIGFNPDQEYNFFKPNPINEFELYEDNVGFEIKSNTNYSNLIGNRIVDVKFKQLNFDVILDYTLKKREISEIVEMILFFENGESLQIACINYDFDNQLKNFNYDLSGQLLISMNNIISFLDKKTRK